MNGSKRSYSSINYTVDDTPSSSKERTSRFSLLLENLTMLEELFSDTDRLKLESDILLQLRKLGALELFNACLNRTLNATTNDMQLSNILTEKIAKRKTNEVIVRSSKKEERKSRRARASSKNALKFPLSLPSKSSNNGLGKPPFSSTKGLKSKSRRSMIARNEAEMSRGVKVVMRFNKIKMLHFFHSEDSVG